MRFKVLSPFNEPEEPPTAQVRPARSAIGNESTRVTDQIRRS
jgi:hypothetical protein